LNKRTGRVLETNLELLYQEAGGTEGTGMGRGECTEFTGVLIARLAATFAFGGVGGNFSMADVATRRRRRHGSGGGGLVRNGWESHLMPHNMVATFYAMAIKKIRQGKNLLAVTLL
jgi:hypothetical protein